MVELSTCGEGATGIIELLHACEYFELVWQIQQCILEEKYLELLDHPLVCVV